MGQAAVHLIVLSACPPEIVCNAVVNGCQRIVVSFSRFEMSVVE
jgi:hypothetical protein